MGFFDALIGRTKPVSANLDRIFRMTNAKLTLEAQESYLPTGKAGVCFRPMVGNSFSNTESEINELLSLDNGSVENAGQASQTEDEYGFRWITVQSNDFEELVTRVHYINATLNDNGWSPQLLCSAFGFTPLQENSLSNSHELYIVYLYKRGTFYPFVPQSGEKRDTETELRIKEELKEDLVIEKDLAQWFPIWGIPLQ
ncbi:MAG: hypothetical protein M1374_03080 [Firmicutes bacterium]|nr:hypothetical protein [Bacillota bacterium]